MVRELRGVPPVGERARRGVPGALCAGARPLCRKGAGAGRVTAGRRRPPRAAWRTWPPSPHSLRPSPPRSMVAKERARAPGRWTRPGTERPGPGPNLSLTLAATRLSATSQLMRRRARVVVRREHGLQHCAPQPPEPSSSLRPGESADRRWLYQDAAYVGVDDLCHGPSSRAPTPPPGRRLSVDPSGTHTPRGRRGQAPPEASRPFGNGVPRATLPPNSHHGAGRAGHGLRPRQIAL